MQDAPLQEGIVNDGRDRIDLDRHLSEAEEVTTASWKAYKEMRIDDESDDRIIKEFTPDGEVRIISIKNGIPKETTYGEKGRKLHEEGTLRVEGKVSPYRFYTSAVALVGTDRDGNSINQGRASLADDFRSLYERIHGIGSYPGTISPSQTAEPVQTAPAESALIEAQREQIEALNEQSRLLREQNEVLRRQNEELSRANEAFAQANANLRQKLEDLRGQMYTRDQVEAVVKAGVLAAVGHERARNEARFNSLETDNAYLAGELADAHMELEELRGQVGAQDLTISEPEEVSLSELAEDASAVEDEGDEGDEGDEKLPDKEILPVGSESDDEIEVTPWPGSDGTDPVVASVKEVVDAQPEPLTARTKLEILQVRTVNPGDNGAHPAEELPEGVKIDYFNDGRQQPRRGGRWVSKSDYKTNRDREAEIQAEAANASGNGSEISQATPEARVNGESNGHAHSTIRRQIIRTGEVGAQMSESAIRYLRGRRSEVDAILGDHSLSESVRAAQLVEMAAEGKAKSRRKSKDDEKPIFVSVRDYSSSIAST